MMKRIFISLLLLVLPFMTLAQEQSTEVETQQTTESHEVTTPDESIDGVSSESSIEELQQLQDAESDLPQESGTVISADAINPIDLAYRILDTNDMFSSDVEEAFMTWQDASVGTIETRQIEGATISFDVADSSLMGPDTVTLKFSDRGFVDDAPRRESKVLVSEAFREGSPNLYKSALLNEVGLLVGLPLTGDGVMQRGLSEEIVPEVSVSEARALEQQATAAKEDLDRNGQVDFYDLVELAKNFVEFPQNYNADLTADGTVNDDDVQQLREVYEFSDPVDANAADINLDNSFDDSSEQNEPENETEADNETSNLGVPASAEEAARSIADVAAQITQENELDSTSENPAQESTNGELATPSEDNSGGQ